MEVLECLRVLFCTARLAGLSLPDVWAAWSWEEETKRKFSFPFFSEESSTKFNFF